MLPKELFTRAAPTSRIAMLPWLLSISVLAWIPEASVLPKLLRTLRGASDGIAMS